MTRPQQGSLLAVSAFIDRNPQGAAAFLISSACLLRIGEVIQLRNYPVNCIKDNLAILSLTGK